MGSSRNPIYRFCLAYSSLLIQIITLLYRGIDISTSLILMFDNPEARLDSLIFQLLLLIAIRISLRLRQRLLKIRESIIAWQGLYASHNSTEP